MRPLSIAFTFALLVGGAALADFDPVNWHDEELTAAGGPFRPYFFPDASGNPRIAVKSSTGGSSATLRLLTQGPPAWITGTDVSLPQNRHGVFVPAPGGGGYLVASRNNTSLMVAVFAADGSAKVDIAPLSPTDLTAVSASLDPSGVLHIGYVQDGTTLGYARRNGEGPNRWRVADVDEPIGDPVASTAIVALSTTSASVYFTVNSDLGRLDLWRARPVEVAGMLTVVHDTLSPLVKFADYVQAPICGTRGGGTERLYYMGSDGGDSWKLRRLQNGVGADLETQGTTVDCRGIHSAVPSDGRERIAWYDASGRVLHYLRPDTATDGPPYEAFHPLIVSGSQTHAELEGFMFTPDDVPCLLYRNGAGDDFVCFPRDSFDTDGNGRDDLLDIAFNSPVARLEVLPMGEAAPGLPFSADRFNVRFPTIGSASFDGTAVVSLSRNLRWEVEYSPDASMWEPADGVASYNLTATNGSMRTFTVVSENSAPGSLSKRFARVVVTRPEFPY
ncbi:hypothetical protein [Luteolibacter marinus]|uniref:hypothetical protein n=1 Tax=Luteolibacter marinus TaxID=2776705 RepID=UPI0018670489|nr:hypothetical protein [Luteolibacter marinus]